MNNPLRKIAAALALTTLTAAQAFAQVAPAPAASPAPTPNTVTAVAPAPVVEKDTLGVSDVKILPALVTASGKVGTNSSLERLTQSLDTQLISSLNGTHKFQLLARSDLDAVMKEHSLSQSGLVDDATAAKMFKLAGAKYLLVVTVTDFQDLQEKATIAATGETAQRRHVTLSCVANIYETDTGKLHESTNVSVDDGDARMDPSYIRATGGNWDDNLPVNLANLASDRIAKNVLNSIYPAKVVAKTGNQVTINRGDGTGIAAGQLWTIFHVGAPIIDPDTHENLGPEEVPIGRAVITTVTARTAIAELMEDHGVSVLDIARQMVERSGTAPHAITPPTPTVPGGPAPMPTAPRRTMAEPPPAASAAH